MCILIIYFKFSNRQDIVYIHPILYLYRYGSYLVLPAGESAVSLVTLHDLLQVPLEHPQSVGQIGSVVVLVLDSLELGEFRHEEPWGLEHPTAWV